MRFILFRFPMAKLLKPAGDATGMGGKWRQVTPSEPRLKPWFEV